jgi:hypothetical protein
MRTLAFGIVIAGAIGTAAAGEPLLLSDVQLERISAGLTNTSSSVLVTSSSCINGSCSVTTSQTSTSETAATARAFPVSANGLQWQLAFDSAWLQQLVSIQAHQ